MTATFELPRAVQQTLGHDLESPAGYRALMVYLMDLLDLADFQIIEQAAAYSGTESTNLVGLRGPYARGGLLLSTAIRPKIPADTEHWSVTENDPHHGTWRDGALFAHGATAGLADFLAKAHAASRIDRDELKQPLVLAGLFGPSAHTGGIMHFLQSGLCAPEMALVGGGTNLELARSHPGELDIRIEIVQTPKSPPSGQTIYDAIYAFPVETDLQSAANRTSHVLEILRELRQQCVFSVHGLTAAIHERPTFSIATDELDVPSHSSLCFKPRSGAVGPALDTVLTAWTDIKPRVEQLLRWHHLSAPGRIQQKSLFPAIRPIGDGLEFALSHWPLAGETTEELLQDIRSEVQRCLPDHLISRVDVAKSVLPFEQEGKSPLLSACRTVLKRLQIPPVISHFRRTTEAWLLPAYEVDTVVFGPGQQPEFHGRGNENVPLIHIERAADFYEAVIRRVCCR
jgi:hypothetical protein